MKNVLFIIAIALLLFACGQKKPTEEEATKRLQEFAEALSYGKLNKARKLVAAGVDVNLMKGIDGESCLHWAVQNADLETMKLLIEAGAKVNAKDKAGRTPLHYVGSLDRAKLLLAAGADVNAKANDGTTVLTEAARCANLELVRLFLSYKADINAKDNKGNTPLDVAVIDAAIGLSDNTLVRFLRKRGAITSKIPSDIFEAIKACDSIRVKEFALIESTGGRTPEYEDNWTPLHEAAKFGDMEILEIVLDMDLNINTKGYYRSDDATPLHIASYHGHAQIVRTLITHGADIEARTELHESTSLHIATGQGREKVVKVLLSEGCNVNAISSCDETPLDVASDKKIKQLLRSYGALSGKELKGEKDE